MDSASVELRKKAARTHVLDLLKVRLDEPFPRRPPSGANGIVLMGTHEPSDKRVAVKIQTDSYHAKVEIEVMERLRDVAQPHAVPFIIGFVGDATAAGWHFIAMEAFGSPEKPAIEWMDLILGPEPEPGAPPPPPPPPVPLETTAQLFADSLVGLLFMHAAGVVHLDIKTQNIMVSPTTEGSGPHHYAVRVIDFGFSRITRQPITMAVGTKSYMAPEQMAPSLARHISYDGAKADVWSLGVLLFSCIFGFFPVNFAAQSDPYFVRLKAAQDDGQSTCTTALGFYRRGTSEFPPPLLALLDRMLLIHVPSRPTLHEVCDVALPWLEVASPSSAQLVRAVAASRSDVKAAKAIARTVAEAEAASVASPAAAAEVAAVAEMAAAAYRSSSAPPTSHPSCGKRKHEAAAVGDRSKDEYRSLSAATTAATGASAEEPVDDAEDGYCLRSLHAADGHQERYAASLNAVAIEVPIASFAAAAIVSSAGAAGAEGGDEDEERDEGEVTYRGLGAGGDGGCSGGGEHSTAAQPPRLARQPGLVYRFT